MPVEQAIEKPSNKLLAVTELDSDTWVAEVKRIRGKKHPLAADGVHALRAEYTRTHVPQPNSAFLLDNPFPKMGTFCLPVSGHSASVCG